MSYWLEAWERIPDGLTIRIYCSPFFTQPSEVFWSEGSGHNTNIILVGGRKRAFSNFLQGGRIYHTRIEMWQIGVRDEARRLGGIGICGHCCCGEKLVCFDGPMFRFEELKGNPEFEKVWRDKAGRKTPI